MGQATAGQHYARERRPAHYPAQDQFRDSKPAIGSDGSVDELLYHNLVEMIPLVESFMDQPTAKSFPRHASLVYTPTPSRDTWPFKKAVEHSTMGKTGRGLPVLGKPGELKDSLLWDNADNMLHNDHNIYAEEIPMLPFPTNHRANRAATTTVEIIQLRSKVEQLEQKLHEKECQLQAAEKNAQKIHFQLNAKAERLQNQVQQKDQAIQKIQIQLFEKQLEVVSLQSLLRKAEVNMQASSMKASSLEEELNGLQCQVGSLLFLVQSHSSSSENDPAIEEAVCDMPLMVVDEMALSQPQELEEEHMDMARRKYLAALIAARENPSEEMLSLVAVLRTQLQELVMCPVMTTNTTNELLGRQPLRLPMC